MAHIHSVTDADVHFSIDAVSREITYGSSEEFVIGQFDHNSQRLTFEMPRMIDNHDMASCNQVQIHYINIYSKDKTQTKEGVYLVDDLQIAPDNSDIVTCSWLVSSNATQYAGTLAFVIRFICSADGSAVDYAWNTAKHSLAISEGINNSASIEEEYADILAQWEARIEALEWSGGAETGKEAISQRRRKPMMTFVDDDGHKNFLTKWIPIIQEKGIPVTASIVAKYPGNYAVSMTWDEVESLPAQGVEVISHSYQHLQFLSDPTLGRDMTEEEVDYQMSTSIQTLREHGIDPMFIAYPGGYADEMVQMIANRYFRAGIGAYSTTYAVNTPPVKTFKLMRYPLGHASYDYTLEALKARVDEAVANDGWLVWMSHAEYESFDETQIGYIRELIDYAREQGVEIVNLEQGFDRIGNVVEAGWDSKDYNYFAVGCDGEIRHKAKKTGITAETLPGAFPPGQITVHNFYAAENAGFATTQGTLLTYNDPAVPALGWQLWLAGGSNDIYKRMATATGWGSFRKIVDGTGTPPVVLEKTANFATFDTPISSFTANAVTYSFVNYTGGSGFPGSAGILTTYRFSAAGNGFDRQTFMEYKQNRLWMRYTDTDGSWLPFVQIGGGSGTTASRPTSAISAGYPYFDTTLNKPIWYTGSGWVDATGTAV